VVIWGALAACSSRTPTERERALSKLPAEAQLIAAADGTALAPFRPVIDAARPFLPTKLDCVADVATTSEVIAVAVSARAGTTIVIVTRAHVAACPALSRIAPDTFVATIGAGAVVDDRAKSPLGDPRWARARSYLRSDPIAIAFERDDLHVLAALQPEPLAAWLTIDAVDAKAIERAVNAWIARRRQGALQPFVSDLAVQTRGSQVRVQTQKLQAEQLALAVSELLRVFDRAPVAATQAVFSCPTPGRGIVRCTDGTRIVVSSLAATLRQLVGVESTPVVAGGDVIGIRLSEDPEALLRRGDVILGLDGHRITSATQLQELAGVVHDRTALAVRRDGTDLILELTE
jgi:hypothetical protein